MKIKWTENESNNNKRQVANEIIYGLIIFELYLYGAFACAIVLTAKLTFIYMILMGAFLLLFLLLVWLSKTKTWCAYVCACVYATKYWRIECAPQNKSNHLCGNLKKKETR